MSLRWTARPRVRAAMESVLLVFSLLGSGCVERSDDWESDVETGESSEGESSEGEHEVVPSCVGEPPIEDLPNAIAWHDLDDDGVPVVRVHVQSEPVTCAQRDSAVTEGTQIRLTIPVAIDVPTRLDLGDIDAFALMSPHAPGNDGDVYTIAWLTGTVDVETLDDERIAGGLHDAYGPFDGCFEAPICPD